ncbi:MAG: phenylacetate-CoA oxygenase/reductase subunit PaaK [Rhodospirillales bacterium]
MVQFYPLKVTEVRRETRESVVLSLEPAPEDREAFTFIPGQYLTFRKALEGEELRRSYSLCSDRRQGCLQVGVKKVPGGLFSTWANDEAAAGAVIEAMVPMGSFHAPLDESRTRHHLFFAAGSGITPILSLIKTTLAEEPLSRVTLVYGNRASSSIMFREDLEDLKSLHLKRFNLLHVLSRESQDIDLFNGRIDAEKCRDLFRHWIDPTSVDLAFICGPQSMMTAVSEALQEAGLAPNQIKFELFAAAQQGRSGRPKEAGEAAAQAKTCTASVQLDGLTRSFEMEKGKTTILDAAMAEGLDVPYACKGGVCSTCRALLVEGEVDMDANFALEDYEVRRGYILTCQSYPATDKVVVDYDQ